MVVSSSFLPLLTTSLTSITRLHLQKQQKTYHNKMNNTRFAASAVFVSIASLLLGSLGGAYGYKIEVKYTPLPATCVFFLGASCD